MDLHQFSESDGLPQIEKVWDLDINELVIEAKPFARGAFSQVFKGEYFGTKICVKMLKGDDAELLKFTCREICSLKFNHPNCVQFIGVAERNDEILIATEYVAGGNLRQYLKDNTVVLPWDLRIKIALDIASGMAFLHSKNVIHRDLKSKNLLVGDNWRIKVCDFGFARSMAGTRRQLMTVCGTNDWMAPEIILGHPYDAKADVFSFGMVLVELITRRKVGEDVRRGPETHYSVDEDLLRSYAPKDTPSDILDLALQCCAYDSNVRPSFKDITKILKSMAKKKEERTTSPFYGVGLPVLRPEPFPFPSHFSKPLPSSNNNSSNSSTSTPLYPPPPAINNNNNNSNHNNHTPSHPSHISSHTSNLIHASTHSSTSSPTSSHASTHSNNNNSSNHNMFSFSVLGAVLPSTSFSSKKEKEKTSRGVALPITGWANSWDTPASHTSSPSPSSSSHGNPLYQPRMFADVVLTDSHSRRLEVDVDSPRVHLSNSPEVGSPNFRKRDHESNNTRLPESVNNKVVAQSARDSPSAPRPKRPSNSSNNKRSRR